MLLWIGWQQPDLGASIDLSGWLVSFLLVFFVLVGSLHRNENGSIRWVAVVFVVLVDELYSSAVSTNLVDLGRPDDGPKANQPAS